jgi:prolyl-tRNA editing enzyme YbaK/EbsC (Cys-tRNA(Pro) deacylase)
MTTGGGGQTPSPPVDVQADDPAERLRRFIDGSGSDAKIVAPEGDAPTVAAAARALGVHQSQIVKSLLFETRQGDVVLVVAAGGFRVNRQRLAEFAGLGHLKLASPDTVLSAAGFAVGGMPPVGHVQRLKVIVDQAVLREPVVYGGGGRSDLLLRIRPDEIIRLTNGAVADLCDPEP